MTNNDLCIVCEDGYIWRIVSDEVAKNVWDKMPIYGLDDEVHEALIECKDDLDRFNRFGIEVGFIEELNVQAALAHNECLTN